MRLWSGLASILARPARPRIEVSGPGAYEYKIVGEAKYQRALETICGGRTEEGIRKNVQAILIPERSNRNDKQAVRVAIEGQTVGYLSRVNARAFRKKLKAAGYSSRPAACPAVIVGGWERGPFEKGHFGVKLDLPVRGRLIAKEIRTR
ncbi:MAG: hypothetical protein WBO34_14970 [Gammaproteobacteria bacterium]